MNYDRLLQLGGIDRDVPPIPGYITKEQLQQEIDGIGAVIPDEASDENQLADKQYVNTSVATASATFRQTWNLVSDLSLTTAATHSDIEAALATAITTADNNDYCFVQIPTADDTPTKIAHTERYKFNGTAWGYEFDVADPSSVPTTLAELQDDATHRLVTDAEKQTWNGKADPSEMSVIDGTGADADKTTITLKSGTSATVLKSHQDISNLVDSTTVRHIVTLTQAQYEQITPDANTMYYIIEQV